MGKPLLFLDFDGVICDSADECFVSSWLAYQGLRGASPSSVPLSDYALFRRYRPLIRRGGDYLLLQRCIDRKIPLSDQADFDNQADMLGEAGMDAFHEKFYAARSGLFNANRSYWLGLNRIYRGIREALPAVKETAWILTTKEVSFVVEILGLNGLEWNTGKIICSGKERKIDIIEGFLTGDGAAVFVDDQIDHFAGAVDERITCYLAAWGYVKPEWLSAAVKVLTKQDFINMVKTLV